MSKPLKALGLIGPGRHGSRYLQERNGGRYFKRVLSRTPRTDLPDWVTGTTDPKEFFAPGLDGVVVATPTQTHLAVVQAVLRFGLDVLVEKPLASSWDECSVLLHAAHYMEQRLCVAHPDLFHEQINALRPYDDDQRIIVEFGGPTGDLSEWAPHAYALAAYLTSSTIRPKQSYVTEDVRCVELEGGRCTILIRRGPKMRSVHWTTTKDGVSMERQQFDGCATSEPSPLANMLEVFSSGREDQRFAPWFTEEIYRAVFAQD